VISFEEKCLLEIALSIDSPNMNSRKIVLDLLTAVSVYDELGYQLVLKGISYIQRVKESSFRFETLVHIARDALNAFTETPSKTLCDLLVSSTSSDILRV
jgi:transaldolase